MSSINPVKFATKVLDRFLSYQLSAFPLSAQELYEQAEELLKGCYGQSPLIKGPYVSLSKTFKMGRDLRDLGKSGVVHPALAGLTKFPVMFAHQDETLKAVKSEKHCLVATGTGSGKTECFLYPILDYCLKLRDENAPEGIVAIIVYPMNALAADQLDRLRKSLAGSQVSFGMYIGSTPNSEKELGSHERLASCSGPDEYMEKLRECSGRKINLVIPPEERATEKEMAEHPPRILLTNVNQLELLLTRGRDINMFVNAPLRFLVFDEAHTYSGATGAEVACLIRRLRSFCGKGPDEVVCIGTSATVTDIETGDNEGKEFASRFFGVDKEKVVLIREEYRELSFEKDLYKPKIPAVDTLELLERILRVLEEDNEVEIRGAYEELTGVDLPSGISWQNAMYDDMRKNKYVAALIKVLEKPDFLPQALQALNIQLGRDTVKSGEKARAEMLCYLALGAATEMNGDPLLRPKVHYFIKGLDGAVVAFEQKAGNSDFYPKLYLSLQKARDEYPARAMEVLPPILSCKTCGQHYYEGYYSDIVFIDGEPDGGQAEGENIIWLTSTEINGKRVVFTDSFIGEVGDPDSIEKMEKRKKIVKMRICRHCGTLHRYAGECANPKCKKVGKLVPIFVTVNEGRLTSCLACSARGKSVGDKVVEPIRPLRAITVSDVHILAQEMINAAPENQQKLLVFSDNRQDAAFQAGWMQDHARRFRLRHLIFEIIKSSKDPIDIGDLQDKLLQLFSKDIDLAKSLAPEVYESKGATYFGKGLKEDLQTYLRIMLVSEFTISFAQRYGLELWGLVRILYGGLNEKNEWIQKWSKLLGLDASILVDGIASLVDSYRRRGYFYDPGAPIYSRYWKEGDVEIQRGFLPFRDVPPKGIKETIGNDKKTYVTQFRSSKGQTMAEKYVSKWEVFSDYKVDKQVKKLRDSFLDELWIFLTRDTEILTLVELKSNKNTPLSGVSGVYQVSSGIMGIIPQFVRYRCQLCHRSHCRMTPGGVCTKHHCGGKLEKQTPSENDYDIAALEGQFSMVMAEEHSAQVPPAKRNKIESEFKKTNGRTNCLVATPTLEMGVDIGALDMILMRNVPPKPSNYWQRAGRAGRRHRMAVSISYSRRSSHDRYFFEDPLRMLAGIIDTPRFNLRNEVMIRKHVHAAVISELLKLTRYKGGKLPEEERNALQEQLREVFPYYIRDYLYEPNYIYRKEPYDVGTLKDVLSKFKTGIFDPVKTIFSSYWPVDDKIVIEDSRLTGYIDEMCSNLQECINIIHTRMMWAVNTQNKLLRQKQNQILDDFDEGILSRCERFLKNLKKDDMKTYTLTVLAQEGFLPGYGIYQGNVVAFAGKTLGLSMDRSDFDLPRPSTIAIREFAPGNMIYANGAKHRTVRFHFPVGKNSVEADDYIINTEEDFIEEKKRNSNSGYGQSSVTELSGLPVCDTDISFFSRISDEEAYRFQMPVKIMGYLKHYHRGGEILTIGSHTIKHFYGRKIKLVNVGPADRVKKGKMGYPICMVCGACRSPYAEGDLEWFKKTHNEKCGKEPEMFALSSEEQVDGILFEGFDNSGDAINMGEAIRIGGGQTLEMDVEDLQLLLLPQKDGKCDLFLYDPMPGGSGLLSQIIDNWVKVVDEAINTLNQCISMCENSCYTCMRTYRNIFYHSQLNRVRAIELISDYNVTSVKDSDIPPVDEIPATTGTATNSGEGLLCEILDEYGFPHFEQQKEIKIGPPYNSTTPDLYYEDTSQDIYLAVYLDGLSKNIHGNVDRQQVDRLIREQLECEGIDVIEIACQDLSDDQAMKRHLKRIAMKLKRKDLREKMS